MKRFKFRLEPLLKLRAYREKEEQKAHATASHKVLSQEESLEKINSDCHTNQNDLRQFLSGSLDMAKLSIFSRYFVKLKKEELLGREMLKVFQRDAEQKRQQLLEATKQRKIFEKLKEKHQEKHHKQFEFADQKEIDEIGIQMNGPNSGQKTE